MQMFPVNGRHLTSVLLVLLEYCIFFNDLHEYSMKANQELLANHSDNL